MWINRNALLYPIMSWYRHSITYHVDISSNIQNFKKYCKMTVSNCYKHSWLLEVTNINRNPILRTYTMFKTEFGSEKYIEAISDCRYRIAMTKLRSSSHTLEVERGRYTKPKTNICERLCPVCNVIEDEIHFLANCKLYDAERTDFFGKVKAKYKIYTNLTTQINSFYWCQARTNKF